MDYFEVGQDLDLIISSFQANLNKDKNDLLLHIQDLINRRGTVTLTNSNEINSLVHASTDVLQHPPSSSSTSQLYPIYDRPGLMLRTRRLPSTRNLNNHQQTVPPKYGLPGLGEYEEKRKKYQAEWKKDYESYIKNHASRPRRRADRESDHVTLDYEEVLSRKREEEQHYRQYNDGLDYDFKNVRAAHSDTNLNSIPVVSFFDIRAYTLGNGASIQDEVAEMNDMLVRMQTDEQAVAENYGFDRYDMDVDNTRPRSYPTESNTHVGLFSNSKQNINRHRDHYETINPEFRGNDRSGHVIQDSGRRDRFKKNTYQEDLLRQVEETRLQRQRERDEQLKLEKKIEEENRNYDPWGRGGAGAPMRDRNGRVIAVRKQLDAGQRYNPNASPQIQVEISPRQSNPPEPLPNYAIPRSPPSVRKPGYLGEHNSESYRDELKKQIEEKKQREREAKEKERLEDERLFRKIQEENERMQRDFEEEATKQKLREDERRRRNEEMQRLQEQQRKDADSQKKKQHERRSRERLERKVPLPVEAPLKTDQGIKSPPLPTLRKQQTSTASKTTHNPSKSVGKKVAVPKTTKGISKDHVLSQLTAMRQQLEKEQQLMQQQIKAQMETDYKVYDHTMTTQALQPDNGKKDSDIPRSFMNHSVATLPKTQEQYGVPPAVKYNPPLLKDFLSQDQSPTASKARKMWPAAIALRATEGLKPLPGESLFLGVTDYDLSSPNHQNASLRKEQNKFKEREKVNEPSDDYPYYPDQRPTLEPIEGEPQSSLLDDFLAKHSIR